MPFTIHSLAQDIGETIFLKNARLLAEHIGSMKIQRKEQPCQVVKIMGGMILKCKAHKIRDAQIEEEDTPKCDNQWGASAWRHH